jgi:ABC-2 type transport system permease protein
VIRVVRAELLKLRTTRMVLWLALLILGLAGFVVSISAGSTASSDLTGVGDQRALVEFAGSAALIALIVGISAMAGEYAHGTIGHTFLVVPVRERVVVAKLVAGAIAGVVLALFMEAVTLALVALWLAGKSVPSHLASRDVLLTLGGILAAAGITGAIGVGYAGVLRRQTPAIVIALIWLLVGEPVLGLAAGAQKFAPGHVLASVVETGHQGSMLLDFWPAVALALGYAAVFAVAGTVVVSRTDVT